MALALAGEAAVGAPAFTELKRFGTLTNITGWNPAAPLVQAVDGTLYGTTAAGEGTVTGTVFKVKIDGSGFQVLKWFTNSWEGNTPLGGLALSGNVLYGTVSAAGSGSSGGVFKLNTDGTGFGLVQQFSGGMYGQSSRAGLVLSGTTLYGTTYAGGTSGYGTVFKVNTDGSGFSVIKSFTGTAEPWCCRAARSTARPPQAETPVTARFSSSPPVEPSPC